MRFACPRCMGLFEAGPDATRLACPHCGFGKEAAPSAASDPAPAPPADAAAPPPEAWHPAPATGAAPGPAWTPPGPMSPPRRPSRARKVAVVASILVVLLVAGLLIPVVKDYVDQEADAAEAETGVWDLLGRGVQQMNAGHKLLWTNSKLAEDFAYLAHLEFLAAQKLLALKQGAIGDERATVLATALSVWDQQALVSLELARLAIQHAAVRAGYQDAATDEERAEWLTQHETLAEGFRRLAVRVRGFANETETLFAADAQAAERAGVSAAYVAQLHEFARDLDDVARSLEAVVEGDADADYRRIEDRDLVPDRALHPDSPYFTDEVRLLFDTFDADGNERIDLGEAEAFFYWVEDHVAYRYDDEDVSAPNPGYAVGDGRPGPDYHQTPAETLAESAGDCEDMNGLEMAFYIYWGITSVQAYVNAQSPTHYDHAIALVYVGADATAAKQVLGSIHYYQIEAGEFVGVPAGAYMIVDNAYSSTFGYISGGIEPGQFQIFEVKHLGEAFSKPVS